MTLSGLVQLLATDPVLADAVELARSGVATPFDLSSPAAARPAIIATLARAGRPLLVVTSTFREGEQLAATLESWIGADRVAYYPAWETLPHERLSPRSDTVGRRLHVLRRIAGRDELPPPAIVVAPVRSVLQPQVRGLADLTPVHIEVGRIYDMARLTEDLADAAYSRVDLVERRGEFAVRGGIVDVFPPTEDHPVRIDFFGDEVEEIRYFTVADQRSTDMTVQRITAAPCRELLITDAVRARAASLLDAHPELSETLERVAQGQAVEGMEALSPALADGLEQLVDVLPEDTLVLVSDPELVRSRSDELVRTSREFLAAGWAAAASGGRAPIDLESAGYRELADVRAHVLERGQGWWGLSSFAAAPDSTQQYTDDGELVDLSSYSVAGVESRAVEAEATPNWRGDTEQAADDIRTALGAGRRVVVTVEGRGLGQRLAEILGEHDLAARQVDELLEPPDAGVVTIVPATQRHGFSLPSVALSVFTTADLSGQDVTDKVDRRLPSRRKNTIQPLELAPGDPVVHEQHGVGRYVEMVQRTVAGATREYLVIEYAASKRGQPGDRLYVPMDQLDQLTRYVGGESPALDRMGGADWNKRKSRARKAVREIAGELIKLYAARQASRGHAFGPDTPWQRELEDAFAYVETPDQLVCIDEVKRDMERVIPMDRLICGDVGYGKTEIAVRAAFKAVQDGKQVAVLVPTTLLVTQHAQTFADRYAGFPVHVAQLSRFQSDAEVRAVREGLASGKVDVVVGTHRLFAGDVHFKDLGLVIIDEEQRFGVEHKEELKKLRLNVDVLAMSATPIPRTLEMAITGIREMSVIQTPPEERHPVLTFAGPFDEGQVVAAVRRELAREGQVFYVHNKVQTIEKTARRLRELVPEARIATAHGQMREHQLERVMEDFWQRRADVLVSTTIVESGLDISTANTLVIERADQLGLSQLHQLRGRVGRSRDRGYAYFFYPREKPLTETAHDRLATMAAHADLGSGMAIAMKDLEIRGAGNLLGGEQSGHIADVGFDLYVRLVSEAVTDFRGEEEEQEPEMRIELPVDAGLPIEYVESERLRLEMYKRLAEVRADADIDELAAEMLDRYGPLPEPTRTLLRVARFRLACRAAGVQEVVGQGNFVRFSPRALPPESRQLRLKRVYPGSVIKETAGFVLVPRPRTAPVAGEPVTGIALLDWADAVLRDIFARAPEPQARAG